MYITDLPLADDYIAYIMDVLNVYELYDVQEEAVKHIFNDENVVVSVPTASGKSLIGYIAMFKHLQETNKVLYMAPYKAIAVEKYRDLKGLEKLGISIALGTGDYQYINKKLLQADIKIMTTEKADSMLIKDISFAEDITLVVIDELHFLGDEERGATMEAFLTKLLTINPNIQVVGLSATIPNYEQIAEWFGKFKKSVSVFSSKRRVPLKIAYYDGEIIHFDDKEIHVGHGKKGVDAIAEYILKMGKQVIIFVATRKEARSLAQLLAKELCKYSSFAQRMFINNLKSSLILEGKEITKTHDELFECMACGIAFHHAGLDLDTRMLIEDMFRERKLNVLVSTSTLSAGVNLPAFAVVVRDMKKTVLRNGRYIRVPLKVNDLLQYVGRAGRPKYDDEGWGIYYVKNPDDYELYLKVKRGELEDIKSQLNNEKVLRRQILALIGMDIAGDTDDILYIFKNSFYAVQNEDMSDLILTIDKDVELLKGMGFIKDVNGMYTLPDLSRWVIKTYLDPLTVYLYLYMIKFKGAYDYFSLLFAFGASPDAPTIVVKGDDINALIKIAENHDLALMQEEVGDYNKYMSGVKVAAVLWDWINEVSMEDIEKKWGIQEGDLNALRQNATWVIASIRIIIENNREYAEDAILERLKRLEYRIRYGVSEELVKLVSIKYVGRKRARALWEAGYRSIEQIANAKPYDLMTIKGFGKTLAEKIIKNAQAVLKISKLEEQENIGD